MGSATASESGAPPRRFWIETLGCPKNQVDSDKLIGTMLADGMVAGDGPDDADLVVVNTCAFVEEARQESIDTVLAIADVRRDDSQLVVTGCMAERYGAELADALPEVDSVAGFGVSVIRPGAAASAGTGGGAVAVSIGTKPAPGPSLPSFDLLNLPRPASTAPWAYVKVAEGCDRACGFCAIPSFRGPQRSRSMASILAEVEQLGAAEIVLVAQDLAAYGRDRTTAPGDEPGAMRDRAIIPLVQAVAAEVERVRLLYLYPSDLTDGLIDAICHTGVPYFDLSLQHVSPPLMRRMRRWGDAGRFLERIEAIRRREPDAAFRSNFIVGYPGETESDHDALLSFVEQADLDWCGFFAFSPEEGTHAMTLDGHVDPALAAERLAELRELQDAITDRKRDELVGSVVEGLVDSPGVARSHREAPEIDGVMIVPDSLPVGSMVKLTVTASLGTDVEAEPMDLLA